MRTDGAKRVEAFAASELHVGLLQIARGDIVEAGVAEKIGKSIVGIAQMRAAARDNEGELPFMFHLFRQSRENNRFFRADNGRRGLQEDQRLFGHFVAKLSSMRRIIAADTNNLGRLDRGEEPHIRKKRRVRAAHPLAPRQTGDLDYAFAFDQAVARRGRRSGIARDIAADFHRMSAFAVPGLRLRVRSLANSPDNGADPGKSGEDHVNHGSFHENVKRAEQRAAKLVIN